MVVDGNQQDLAYLLGCLEFLWVLYGGGGGAVEDGEGEDKD